MTNRLVAASILRHHDGVEAVRLLQGLARDAEPVVAAAALTRLAEIDTKLVLPVVETVLESSDAGVRLFGVDALFRHPSDEHIRTLGKLLSDPHPDVRVRVSMRLGELAAKWGKSVIDEGVRALAASDWRGQEQAAILLAKLAHKPAAGRLVELLKSNRSEVLVAVGWGLRQLAVPETLPKILEHVRLRHADILRSGSDAGLRGVTADALDNHLSQLIQLLGQARYQPADPVLRALVPRFLRPGIPPVFSPVRPEARAAAIFALGMLHEGKPEDALVTLIEGRLTGDGMLGKDDERVRRLAAVSLARMKATQSLPALREHSAGKDPVPDVVAHACRWAIGRLTGEPVPPAGTIEVPQRDWFLVPFTTTKGE